MISDRSTNSSVVWGPFPRRNAKNGLCTSPKADFPIVATQACPSRIYAEYDALLPCFMTVSTLHMATYAGWKVIDELKRQNIFAPERLAPILRTPLRFQDPKCHALLAHSLAFCGVLPESCMTEDLLGEWTSDGWSVLGFIAFSKTLPLHRITGELALTHTRHPENPERRHDMRSVLDFLYEDLLSGAYIKNRSQLTEEDLIPIPHGTLLMLAENTYETHCRYQRILISIMKLLDSVIAETGAGHARLPAGRGRSGQRVRRNIVVPGGNYIFEIIWIISFKLRESFQNRGISLSLFRG